MPDPPLSFRRRALGDERGMALPMALGVTMVLSALAAGIFAYVTTNQGAAKRVHADQRSYGLAEAGLSSAFSVLKNASNPYSASSVPASATAAPVSGAEYWGSLSGTTWTLYGRGTVANPTGPGAANVVRTVSMQAQITTTTTGDTRPYDYFFVDQPTGCFTMGNTVTMEVPLYVRGDLCLQNNSLVSSPAVHVLGNVNVNSPQASVGTSASPIPDFSISGNCYRSGALTPCSSSATSRVWAGAYGTTPPNITKPTVDLPYWYANANLGPLSPCSSGSFPSGFDNDGLLNVSRGNVDLTPASSYNCVKTDLSGNVVGQITWVPGANPSKPGKLTIKGVIFIDGNLTWSNLSLIEYDGRGTIYASGTLSIQNQADLCGVDDCDDDWDPSVDFLSFVVGSMQSTGGTAPLSGDVGNKVTFQGALFLVNDYDQDNNSTIWGPVIARNATVSNSTLFKPLPDALGGLPPGLPADTIAVTTVEAVPGSYAG